MKEIDSSKIAYFSKVIIKWERLHFADFPWRKTTDGWHSLVAEMMLQRTNANQVLPVYNRFCMLYPNPEDYSIEENCNIFNSLGLKWRNIKLKELTEIIAKCEIPIEKNQLMELPGIGDYIASAYRSLHLGIRDIIIDSNVVRILGRFFGFLTDPETRRSKKLRELADKLTPQKNFKIYNYGLIDFSRNICKIKPSCYTCCLKKKCNYYPEIKK